MMPELNLARIHKGAAVLMVLVGLELIYYTGKSFWRAYRFSFGEPERWNTHWMIDQASVIGLSQRVIYFSIWAFVILASIAAFIAGLALLNRCRKGAIFDMRTANAIRNLGLFLAFAMIVDQIFQAMDAFLITLSNAEGPRPIAFFYDPSDIKTFIMAVILILFGWVMRTSIQIDRENRGFI